MISIYFKSIKSDILNEIPRAGLKITSHFDLYISEGTTFSEVNKALIERIGILPRERGFCVKCRFKLKMCHLNIKITSYYLSS